MTPCVPPCVALCAFRTLSKHATSLGWVRYQRCACGRFRVLLAGDVLKDGPAPSPAPLTVADGGAPTW